MSEERHIDLTPLDPRVDPERWAAVMAGTLARVDAVLTRPRDALTLIASWSRPLVRTAGLMIALLIPIEVILERREAGAEQVETLVRFSTRTALDRWQPTGEDLSRVLAPEALP